MGGVMFCCDDPDCGGNPCRQDVKAGYWQLQDLLPKLKEVQTALKERHYFRAESLLGAILEEPKPEPANWREKAKKQESGKPKWHTNGSRYSFGEEP